MPSLVATLASPSRLDESLLPPLASPHAPHWHPDHHAVDMFFDDTGADALRQRLAALIGDRPIDVIVQPVATRRKKFLLADMESTLIEQELLDEMAAMLGFGAKVAEITRRGMNGELDFAESLKARAALFKGQPASLLDAAAQRITLMPGAVKLVTAMKRAGAQCWMVTGGFTCFTGAVAQRLGLDRVIANELIVRDGVLTGEVGMPIVDRNTKKEVLEQACRELNLTLADCVTVGDGANDLPMLQTCNAGGGLGVAYHAKPAVRAVIPHQVNHSDLRLLMWAQRLDAV